MEVIKGNYRGIRTDGKGWIYGYLAVNVAGSPCIMESAIMGGTEFFDEENPSLGKFDGMFIGMFVNVIPETVGIFLNIHDSEGTAIYDGDLLDFDEKEWGGEFIPEAFTIKDVMPEWNLKGTSGDVSVWRKKVGTIHDKLLKNDKDE